MKRTSTMAITRGWGTRRIKWIALAALAALVAVAAAGAIGNGSGAERVNATFDGGAIDDPTIKTCAITRDGTFVKFTADYSGRLATDRGQVLGIIIHVKDIANVETGLGMVKGTFSLVDVTTGVSVGSGDYNAAFIGDASPSSFGGELDGLMVGSIEDPNERTIIWAFSANISDGERSLTGFIGDRNLMPAAAILFPPDPCVR